MKLDTAEPSRHLEAAGRILASNVSFAGSSL